MKDYFVICSAYFFGQTLKKKLSRSWATRTDSLSCYLSVFILGLSECKQVEFAASFIADFDNF